MGTSPFSLLHLSAIQVRRLIPFSHLARAMALTSYLSQKVSIGPQIMATTTVTGHGRRSSLRQPELQMPTKTSTPQPVTSSPIDKFPPYEESLDAVVGSGRPTPTPSVKYAPGELWEPRKSAFYSRDHANESSRNPKHRPRKSISEAITTIRTRHGSVSANAQELAEALRAPVSYRLTVRLEVSNTT